MTTSDRPEKKKSEELPEEEVIDVRKSKEFSNIETSKTKTRSRLAKYLVVGYLFLNMLTFLYLFAIVLITQGNLSAINSAAAQVVDFIKTLGAVFGGLLGTVITYYFLNERNSEN